METKQMVEKEDVADDHGEATDDHLRDDHLYHCYTGQSSPESYHYYYVGCFDCYLLEGKTSMTVGAEALLR